MKPILHLLIIFGYAPKYSIQLSW